MLADPPGVEYAIVEAILWISPVIFLLIVTGMFLLMHIGLAPPSKRVLNGWLIILLPLLAIIYCIICRPALSYALGKDFSGVWWTILLYPSLVVTYWLVFRLLFAERIERSSAEPQE